MLTVAGHVHGWPVPEGGSAAITRALASLLAELGGTVVTGHPVRSRADLPAARITLFDTGPETVAEVYGDALPGRTRRAYRRYRHGPAAYKVDLAVRGGVPWTNEAGAPGRDRARRRDAGGDRRGRGRGLRRTDARAAVRPRRAAVPGRPDPRPADPERATSTPSGPTPTCRPAGRATGEQVVLDQLERFAPGLRERVVATAVRTPADFAAGQPQLRRRRHRRRRQRPAPALARPRLAADPYATGLPGVYLCSAATPPGAGVHGMCGYRAATRALRWLGRVLSGRPSRWLAGRMTRRSRPANVDVVVLGRRAGWRVRRPQAGRGRARRRRRSTRRWSAASARSGAARRPS